MIMPTDFVIVCAHSEDDIFSLQASTVSIFSDFAIKKNSHGNIFFFLQELACLDPLELTISC